MGQLSCKILITTDKLHMAEPMSVSAFNIPFAAKNGPYFYIRVDVFRRFYCTLIMDIPHHPVTPGNMWALVFHSTELQSTLES